MPSEAKNFSWLDVIKAIWYFLAQDRKRFSFYYIVLFCIFFYDLVPTYVVGKIIDFFSVYHSGQPLNLFYFYVIFISVTYILASLIRLKSKNALNIINQHTRARARIWGFERLTEFSLEWHNKENTGNKLQRIFTGADAIRGLSKLLGKDLLRIVANVTGVALIFLFIDFKFTILVFIYIAAFLSIEYFSSKKYLL